MFVEIRGERKRLKIIRNILLKAGLSYNPTSGTFQKLVTFILLPYRPSTSG